VKKEDEIIPAARDQEIARRIEGYDPGRVRPVSLEDFKKRLSSFTDGDRFCGVGAAKPLSAWEHGIQDLILRVVVRKPD
jgi:hypothetical protein